MNQQKDSISGANLFSGIDFEEIASLLVCLKARRHSFHKGELIVEEGKHIEEFGVVLSGHARSIIWDASGRIVLLAQLQPGSEIGVMLAARPDRVSPVTVQAEDEVVVLSISYERLINRCVKNCLRHERIIKNYISAVATKGLTLHERVNCLLKPTLREKIMSYLMRLSQEQKSRTIRVPLDRRAMAEYLNAERSALSRELSGMKRDGLIKYRKDVFELL